MRRIIEAPDKEWLTDEEAASWLGIRTATFRGMVKAGSVPKGRRLSGKAIVWHWELIWAVSVLIKFGQLLGGEEETEPEK